MVLMKKTVVGIILLLMIVGNLINLSDTQASSTDFFLVPTVMRKFYIPQVSKSDGGGGPTAGYYASSNEIYTFYVLPDRVSVKNYSVTISVGGCGTYKITHTVVDVIANSQFAFTGTFYASGTFSSSTNASGVAGLSNFDITGCGKVSGGPWSWTATWKNSNQPDIREAFPVTEGDPNLALPDETIIVEKIE
jgi:hypothetical protein